MDFKQAVAEKNPELRKELIEQVIYNECWEEHLSDMMHRGGWPDDALVNTIEIDDDVELSSLVVTLGIDFLESIPTGCANVNVPFEMSAHATLTIDRATGEYEIEVEPDYSDDDGEEGDYY